MHVRRTDKIEEREAEFIHSSLFWKAIRHAETLAQSIGPQKKKDEKLQVYIASDDATVLPELRQKFKDGNFVGDESPSGASQKTLESRYSDLFSIIRDIWVLSNCDYVIGTFSSHVS